MHRANVANGGVESADQGAAGEGRGEMNSVKTRATRNKVWRSEAKRDAAVGAVQCTNHPFPPLSARLSFATVSFSILYTRLPRATLLSRGLCSHNSEFKTDQRQQRALDAAVAKIPRPINPTGVNKFRLASRLKLRRG